MLVSHDRALLRAVCDEFWMVSRGGVAPFDGDLDDYQRYLLDEAKRQREEARRSGNATAAATPTKPAKTERAAAAVAAAPAPAASRNDDTQQRKLEAQRRQQRSEAIKPLRKELDQIDQQMQALANEKGTLEVAMTTASAAAQVAQNGRRLKAVEEEIQQLEERWLELTDQIETAAS
jgi:ATP-binding cassette subfamily F protein 3